MLARAALLSMMLLPALAGAQTGLAGRTIDEIDRPVAGLQVRAWAETPEFNSLSIAGETLSAEDGSWRIEGLAPGRYKVHVRMPNGMEANWADRWLDNEDPFAAGWVSEDADWIEVVDGEVTEGLDLYMLVFGGFAGRVLAGGEALPGVLVRAETLEDCRKNHVDETRTGADSDGYRLGRFSFRGLVPGPTRVVAWHPSGELATTVFALPFDVQADDNPELEDFEMVALQADPHEPNDAPADVGAGAPDAELFEAVPPMPWKTSPGARISPRGGADQDWYCMYANPGDRFLADVQSRIGADEACDEHPWIDPMVSIWRLDPDTAEPLLLIADDDSGTGRRGAHLDTGLLSDGGRVCALVTTFGDSDWSGAGQQSWGEYVLELRMGNRPPTLDVMDRGIPAAAVVAVTEGDAICFDVSARDPDGDAPQLETELRDKDDQLVEQARFVPEAGGSPQTPAGRWCWTAGVVAGDRGPYLFAAAARDAEFADKLNVRIEVRAVNQPPTVPTLVSPADGDRIGEDTATLVIENSQDADGDPLKYHFEVFVGGVRGVPEHASSVPEPAEDDGLTSWTTPVLGDEVQVCWRARADDGRTGGLSDWAEASCFLVDSRNESPQIPRWNKPGDGELLYVVRPMLSVWNAADPENDPLQIEFALSDDAEFLEASTVGVEIPQAPRSATTSWRPDDPLSWGGIYYARARALDDRGGVSAWTPIRSFRLKVNSAPTPGRLRSPGLVAACEDKRLTGPLPDPLVIKGPYDPEGETVTVEVQLLRGGGAPPALDVVVEAPADGSDVEISTTGIELLEGVRYLLRIRTTDGEAAGTWVECELWMDSVVATPTGLEILAPAEGEALVAPLAERGRVSNPAWADRDIPGRELRLAWRLCPMNEQADSAETPDAGERTCDDAPTPIPWLTKLFDPGVETVLGLGQPPLGLHRLEVCAYGMLVDLNAPQDGESDHVDCLAGDAVTFVVAAAGSSSSDCDCTVGAPNSDLPNPWWVFVLLSVSGTGLLRRKRRTRMR